MVNVGKYKSPMDSMGSHIFSFTSACFKLLLDPSDFWHRPRCQALVRWIGRMLGMKNEQ